MQSKNFRIEIGIICFFLFVIISLQYRTIKKNSALVSQAFGDDQLKGALIQSKEKYEKMTSELEKTTKKLEEVRSRAEKVTTSSNETSENLKKNDMLLELSNAGAQAIEINGQRIVNSSCVTCAGNVISINGERVSSPFTIKAIGSPDLLYGALTRPGGYVQIMQEQSLIAEVKKSNNIQIGKFAGTLPQKYMKTKGE